MDVSGQDQLFSLAHGGKHHGLHRGGGAVDHKKGGGGGKRLGRQHLRLADNGGGMHQAVYGFAGVHVQGNTLFPQQRHKLRIAPAPFVAGHVKRNNAALLEIQQRLHNGCPFLRIAGHFITPFGVRCVRIPCGRH
ncbi:hypothetical protein SDC9_194097 [bioreactor metagenome]|uniref:Uncharacterized protein n=1 Tax=bioreactor metagenome TaxID=1076179 RepID=A0A645I5D5_9ZZZZ